MCFSGPQALFFSALSVVGAAAAYYRWKCPRQSISILYFGAMEFLQFIQYMYIAEPEDDYAMCKNPTNQFLTVLGLVHIWFQPVFVNMYLRSLISRADIKSRIERDLIHRMCMVAALWFASRYIMAAFFADDLPIAPRPTEECPNYEWIRDGYDAGIQWTTPNVPGHSCTFRSNTPTGHLAWASPLYQATYFIPHVSVHFFTMFVPNLFNKIGHAEFVLLVTGPLLAAYLTASNHEQPSIWCFYSAYQVCFGVFTAFFEELPVVHPPQTLTHKGDILGDNTLEYALVPADGKKVISN